MSREADDEKNRPCRALIRQKIKTFCVVVALVLASGATTFCFATDKNPSKIKLPLTRIDLDGSTSVSRQEIQKILRLKIGRRTTAEKVEQSFTQLRPAYLNKGFLNVQISTAVTQTDQELSIAIRINEGPVYHVSTITVQGNQEITSKKIKREMEMRPGDIFSPQKAIDGNKRLYASGCFDAVDLKMSTSTTHTVDIVIKVRERHQQFVKGGAGYGSESKERLSIGYEDQNFLGGARRADIKYTYSGFLTEPEKNETRKLETTLIQPFIFDTRMEGQVSLNHTRDFREAYDSIENELRASLERRFRTAFSLRINYRYQGTQLTRVSPEAETPSVTSIDAIGPSLRYDNTDDPFLPRNGWRVLASVEEGMKLFKNDVGFHKSEGRLGRFDTTESGWTFFEGFQTGLILPHSGDKADVIPINERFFLGGANSVRGYSERSLGPKDANGAPLGGTFFVVTNLELRHRIYKRVFGVMFFDMGNLFDYDPGATDPQVNLNSINDLAQSCGVGIRFHSPVGAIRLEGGYQLNPEGGSGTKFDDRTALHFSIGEVF